MTLKSTCIVEPKILVISNNAFSETRNNGKTLASFFSDFQKENIAQLFFSPELPNGTQIDNYFRITDVDIIKSIFDKNCQCGSRVWLSSNLKEADGYKSGVKLISKIFTRFNFARLLREIFWRMGRWKTNDLKVWLDEFAPNIIFYCAGDSIFTYAIANYIRIKFNAKLILYTTDDYILPVKSLNPLRLIRRKLIYNKMKTAVDSCDLFVTISKRMQETYKEYLGKDSVIALNMTESLKDDFIKQVSTNDILFVYAGGFSFKRDQMLNLLAKSIKKINVVLLNKKKVFLRIFSNQTPSKLVLKKLSIEGASEFCGSLNSVELKKVLNTSDVLVHVEAFDKKSIESTKLSISTKIPEYLSLEKPIFAVGPAEIASMDYLRDVAFCVTDTEKLTSSLLKFIDDEGIRKNLAKNAFNKFKKFHDKKYINGEFKSLIISLNTT